MDLFATFLSTIVAIPIEHMVALIALAGLGLAGFALYVVLRLETEHRRK
jgi:hypothetical protein